MLENNKVRMDKVQNNILPPNYQESEVGIIPNDWNVMPLRNVIKSLDTGVSVNSEDIPCSQKNIGILKTSAVANGKFIPSESKTIVEKDIDRAKLNPQKGSIIISRMNTPGLVGEIGYVDQDYPYLYLPDRLWQTCLEENVDGKWLAETLSLEKIKLQIKNIATGTSNSMKNISKPSFLSIVIPIPSYCEQIKIAEILSTWDKAIELKEKLIDEKKNQKNGLMEKLLTGKVRLPGFHGEWKEVRVSEAIKESKIIETEPFLEKQITVRLHLNGVQVRDVNGTEKLGATTLYKRFSGQFIYGKQNFHNGALGLIPCELDGYVTSSDIPSFDFNNGFDPHYFFYYWSRSNVYSSLEGLTTGTGSKRLNPKTFLNLNMKVPGLEEQENISQVIRVCDKEIQLLEKELEHLKEQKKGLMQLLLTGIVRVNTHEN